MKKSDTALFIQEKTLTHLDKNELSLVGICFIFGVFL